MNQNHHTPSLDCAANAPLLPLAAHDLLNERQASALQAHLATCAECRAELASYDQAEAALRRTFAPPPGALPPFSKEEIVHMLSNPAKRAAPSSLPTAHIARPQHQRGNLLAFAAALVLVLLAVGIFSFPGLQPQPAGKGTATPVSKKLPPVDISHFLLNSISMVSPDEGWAVGTTLLPQTSTPQSGLEYLYGAPVILHYSQGHWRPEPLPLRCQSSCHMVLHSIAMVSATEGWAVGNSVLPLGADGFTSGLILHYAGGKWSIDSYRDSTLSHIVMSSANDGWMLGEGVSVWSGSKASAPVFHYNGRMWTPVNDPAFVQISPQSITALSATNVWLVGAGPVLPGSTGFDGDASEVILHYDGRQWTKVASDLANFPILALAMVSPDAGWAVGCLTGGLGEHLAHPEKALVEQYIQGRWQQAASFASSSGAYYCLHGIALVSANEGWAVGSDGLIVHGLHGVWTRIASPTGQTLNSIVMLSPTEGWAVGDQGTILHYVHGSWSRYQG